MFQANTPNRVVSTYFVPGVRMSLLDNLSTGAQVGTDLSSDVTGDIVQAEVTRVCTGACQYSVTLNNWYTTTANDRASLDTSNLKISENLSGLSQPRFPRYKYNDFRVLEFGQRLRLDMRYWPKPPTDTTLSQTATLAQNWVPMISGPITDMKFDFGASGSRVTISGVDDLSLLKDKTLARKEFASEPEKHIILDVLKLAQFPLNSIADSQVPWPSFADDGGQGIVESILDGQSYLEFIQKLADRLDFEVFIEFSDLTDATSALEFHFEPARSRVKPDMSSGDVYVLRRDTNLIEFSPSIKVEDQPSQSEVKGRHRDRNNPTKVVGTADPSILSDELHPDDSDGDSQPLVPAPLVRAFFFPNRNDNPISSPNETNIDPDRANVMAQAQLRRKAREFFTIEGTTLGLPRLRPGNHVQIMGMRPPFDGFYYVTKTVHTYGADGLRTKFSARRPGMALPPYGA